MSSRKPPRTPLKVTALNAAKRRVCGNHGIWQQAAGRDRIARLTRESILQAALDAAEPHLATAAFTVERARLTRRAQTYLERAERHGPDSWEGVFRAFVEDVLTRGQ